MLVVNGLDAFFPAVNAMSFSELQVNGFKCPEKCSQNCQEFCLESWRKHWLYGGMISFRMGSRNWSGVMPLRLKGLVVIELKSGSSGRKVIDPVRYSSLRG